MTPAVLLLERERVEHTLHRYELGETELDGHTLGEAVAASLGVEPARVAKTLVARLEGGELVVAVVPVDRSLDLKALARAAGARRAEMAPPADAERATGYVTGGISPFGQRRRLRCFADASLTAFATVLVSAGRRGLQVEVRPEDLLRLCAAHTAELT
jgi:Cys-tRNA(Pro)/Cys-tRNA(Cys) deacylase